jgi:hypothetical protein
MGDVMDFDRAANIVRDDKPPHIDRYGLLIMDVYASLIHLRDGATDEQSRQVVDLVVHQFAELLMRYAPSGAA